MRPGEGASPELTGWSEWDAVACILGAVPLFGPKWSTRFMDPEDYIIDFEAIEASCYAHSERLLYELARNLWDASATPSVRELVNTLDDNNFELALRAMRIARRWQGGSGGPA